MTSATELRVCHIASGDLWAGAEVQLATTAAYLVTQPDVRMSAVLLNEGRLASELRRLGVAVAVIDETRHNAATILASLTRFLRDHPVDVVHTHRYKESVVGTIAARLAGVPQVIRTIHGLNEAMTGWRQLKGRAYETLDNMILRSCADRVVAVSKQMRHTLRDSYPPAMLTQIHNGIDLQKIRVRRSRDNVRHELGCDDRTILIGTVGRLSPVKGHDRFLRAARLILDQEPNARFVIVGGGPLERELADLAAQLQIDQVCRLVGARSDVYDLMSAMDIFVLPSLSEGMPMAMLEAMALGTPTVATSVGGVPEVIRQGVTGLLVSPGDEPGLAVACLKLARDRERARVLGAQGKRLVEGEFSHEKNGRALIDTYRQVQRQHATRVTALGLFVGLPLRAAEYGVRGVRQAFERWQMNRLRRNPAPLMSVLKRATSILIVCQGNIIRSPFAACLVAQAVGDRVSIRSVGLGAEAGSRAHPRAIVAATAQNIDLSRHSAAPITLEAVATSDVIFVMDVPQLAEIRQRFPEARAKTFLLASLAPNTPLEIRDPVHGDQPLYMACYEHIARAVDPIACALGAEPAIAWRGSEPCLCR